MLKIDCWKKSDKFCEKIEKQSKSWFPLLRETQLRMVHCKLMERTYIWTQEGVTGSTVFKCYQFLQARYIIVHMYTEMRQVEGEGEVNSCP